MYFKCTLKDGSEVYKSIEESDLREAVDYGQLYESVYSQTGDRIKDQDCWGFTEIQERYSDIVDVDLREILNIEQVFQILSDDLESLDKVEFLEDSSYQHALASLSLSNPKDIYKKRVTFTAVERDEEYEPEDPYSDEPTDYDYD